MKQSDGLFHQVFDEIAKEYPTIENEHWIIDIGAAKMADTPEVFDVIVTLNLYGDVLSDIAAQIAGSVGLAGSANIGESCAMFEAIHGSAPRRAGQNMANPSGLIQGAILMLNHIGQNTVAEKIQNAWLKTIEDGTHTYDVFKEGISTEKVGTKEFANAVIANLGNKPAKLNAVNYSNGAALNLPKYKRKPAAEKSLLGVDLFVHWSGNNPDELAEIMHLINSVKLELTMITNRGIKVWPAGFEETFCTDHWRCRFKSSNGINISNEDIIKLLQNAFTYKIDVIKTENLYAFDGKPAFSLGQGQ
jgi:isocitrate dehydrogenase